MAVKDQMTHIFKEPIRSVMKGDKDHSILKIHILDQKTKI